MSESIFGDLDIASAEDNPFEIAPGTYQATISDVSVRPTKAGDKTGLIIEYTITDENETGKKVSEWKEIPAKGSKNEATAASFLKLRLSSLGIPENRMNSLQTDDLMNLDVVVSVKKNGEYTNVVKVALDDGPNVDDSPFG